MKLVAKSHLVRSEFHILKNGFGSLDPSHDNEIISKSKYIEKNIKSDLELAIALETEGLLAGLVARGQVLWGMILFNDFSNNQYIVFSQMFTINTKTYLEMLFLNF